MHKHVKTLESVNIKSIIMRADPCEICSVITEQTERKTKLCDHVINFLKFLNQALSYTRKCFVCWLRLIPG